MNWRENLKSAVSDVLYAKDAKAHERADSNTLLHLLHRDSREPSKAALLPDQPARKALIQRTLYQISDLWSEVESSGGSLAWEWILRGSPHGERIQQAEDKVNAIGSKGSPATLKAACDAWVFAWCDGVEAWKRHLPTTEAGPEFIQKVRQQCER